MRHSAGQAVIFALLLTAVVITVGLAVVSQSIVDVKTSTQSQETVKAFTAAEAGIEYSLASALVGTVNTQLTGTVGSATYNAKVTPLGLNQNYYILPRTMVSGDAQTLWFVSHDPNGDLACPLCATLSPVNPTFDVYFGNSITSPLPALVVDIYYKSSPGNLGYSDIKIARAAYDPDSSRQSSDKFDSPAGGSSFTAPWGDTYPYKAIINLDTLGIDQSVYKTPNGLQIIRARILYATTGQSVAFDFGTVGGRSLSGGAGLPSQGFQPQSVGTIQNSSSIKLTSVYPWPDAFAMFDHAIFAGSGGLCKGTCP